MSGGPDMWRAEVMGTLWLYGFSLLIFSMSRKVIGGKALLRSGQHVRLSRCKIAD